MLQIRTFFVCRGASLPAQRWTICVRNQKQSVLFRSNGTPGKRTEVYATGTGLSCGLRGHCRPLGMDITTNSNTLGTFWLSALLSSEPFLPLSLPRGLSPSSLPGLLMVSQGLYSRRQEARLIGLFKCQPDGQLLRRLPFSVPAPVCARERLIHLLWPVLTRDQPSVAERDLEKELKWVPT